MFYCFLSDYHSQPLFYCIDNILFMQMHICNVTFCNANSPEVVHNEAIWEFLIGNMIIYTEV